MTENKKRVGDSFFGSLLGICSGLVFVIFATQALFRFGFSVSAFHWILFPIGYLIPCFIRRKESLKFHILTLVLLLVAIFASSMLMKRLYAVNWDGMLIHKEFVMAFQDGWNPVQDKYFKEGIRSVSDWENQVYEKKLAWGGYSVRFHYLFESIIAKTFGSTEAGKGIRILLFIIPFLSAFELFRFLEIEKKLRVPLAFGIALNPVSIFQFVSFWEDIYFACFSISCILVAFRLVQGFRVSVLLLFILNILLLIGVKKAGIGFALILLPVTVLAAIIEKRIRFKLVLLVGAITAVSIALGIVVSKSFGLWVYEGWLPYDFNLVRSITLMSHYFDARFIEAIPRMASLSGPVQFMLCTISEASMVAQDLSIKFPFIVTPQEFYLYFHIFTAPWFGGFGPLFGFASIALVVVRIACRNIFERKMTLHFYWTFFLLGILFIMPSFAPRWIPFLWLFPFFLFLSFDFSDKNQDSEKRNQIISFNGRTSFWRHLARVLIWIVIGNSLFVLILNLSGHLNASRIIEEELDFLKNHLKQPILVDFNDFPSNREWFESHEIDFDHKSLYQSPVVFCLHRTNTHIDISDLDRSKPVIVLGREWDSVEDWAASINRRNGSENPQWSPWIKPVIYHHE